MDIVWIVCHGEAHDVVETDALRETMSLIQLRRLVLGVCVVLATTAKADRENETRIRDWTMQQATNAPILGIHGIFNAVQ